VTTPFEIASFLESTLEHNRYSDLAINGLQLHSGEVEVSRVAVAVDSGLSIVEQAVASKAQLLVVHHGLFWGKIEPLVGALADKVKLLLNGNCSLFASHLPLDGHLQYGNAAQMAALLGLEQVEGFFEFEGCSVGVQGRTKKPLTIDQIKEILSPHLGDDFSLALPFGVKQISSIGIVTGSGSAALASARLGDLDLLISGEPKQECYHTAKELGINALFLGHYATETVGVRAIAKLLESKFKVETIFIDEPTGI